jgi:Zn-dependent peptidase ImmA (M78 family)
VRQHSLEQRKISVSTVHGEYIMDGLLERGTMAEVPVNGEVLAWARKLRGLSVDTAADLLNVSPDELRLYESGYKKPLVGFLRLIAKQYRINFTSLLMPEPLPLEQRPTDHRSRTTGRSLSIDTLVAIEEVNEALEAFDDIGDEVENVVPHLSIGNATLEDNPEAVAIRERRRFGVTVEEQRAWTSHANARIQWRQRIENRGVFTYMIPMPIEELSGFSILRKDMAAVCVNDRESTEGAKIFTLFHEYCHLLLRQTGISDENDSNRVEKFCNQFAACFLIPRGPLVEEIGSVVTPHEFSDTDIKRFSNRFRVSNRAMALRLEETGLAPRGFYKRRTAPWDLPVERPPRTDGQPDYIRIRLKRIGRLHAATVLRAVKRQAINSFDASQLIGLQPAFFGKVQAVIG